MPPLTSTATPLPSLPPIVTNLVEPDGGSSNGSAFATGDIVRVQLELDVFRVLQEGHGGWMDDMAEVSVT